MGAQIGGALSLDRSESSLAILESTPQLLAPRRCGFSSADVMTRAFRKRFGVGPEAYRLHFGRNQTQNVNTSY